MSGYTLGDSPTVFLARFEGSTGTQTWLSHLGEATGMPHRAQSVAVVEGTQHGYGIAGGGGGNAASSSDGATGAGAPVVEGEGAAAEPGNDARVVVVGYNTSEPSAESHSNTGFTAAADTKGEWMWFSVSHKADSETAIAVGGGGGGGGGGPQEDSLAFIVGTVAASEASPGNYLFLDIQRVVREPEPTPIPTVASSLTPGPTLAADPMGGASSTTGLSQGSSLWLLIIAPIFVVLSCIMMVGYVSKQCAIAFGTRMDSDGMMDGIEFSSSHGGDRDGGLRLSGSTRALRRNGSESSRSEWHDGASPPRSAGRRKREGKGGHAWSRSAVSAFRDKDDGPPYRKLGMKDRARGGSGGGKMESPSTREGGRGAHAGEVELGVTARHSPFDSPLGGSQDGGRRRCGDGSGDRESCTFGSHDGDGEWEAFEGEATGGGSHNTGNPRDDEHMRGSNSDSPFGSSDAPRLLA